MKQASNLNARREKEREREREKEKEGRQKGKIGNFRRRGNTEKNPVYLERRLTCFQNVI